MEKKQRKYDQDIEDIVRDVLKKNLFSWDESDQQEYYGPERVIDLNNIPLHQERLFDFNFEACKEKADISKKLNERHSFWKDCLMKMQSSKDYHLYKMFQNTGWQKTPINPTQDPWKMLKSLRTYYRIFDHPQPGEAYNRFYWHIGELLYSYLHSCITEFKDKIESEIRIVKHILKERENWKGPIYKLAEKLRAEALAKQCSFRAMYEFGAKRYLWKHEELSAERLEKAYDKAVEAGLTQR